MEEDEGGEDCGLCGGQICERRVEAGRTAAKAQPSQVLVMWLTFVREKVVKAGVKTKTGCKSSAQLFNRREGRGRTDDAAVRKEHEGCRAELRLDDPAHSSHRLELLQHLLPLYLGARASRFRRRAPRSRLAKREANVETGRGGRFLFVEGEFGVAGRWWRTRVVDFWGGKCGFECCGRWRFGWTLSDEGVQSFESVQGLREDVLLVSKSASERDGHGEVGLTSNVNSFRAKESESDAPPAK